MTQASELAHPDSGTRDERSSDLRARILTEAMRLFAERGYGATSIREVVARSGCTKPALYYYFRNKEALFLEALRETTEMVTGILEGELADEEAPVYERLSHGLSVFLDYLARDPLGMRLIIRADLVREEGAPEFDFDSVRKQHLQMIMAILSSGQQTGEIRADVDLEDAAYAISGMVDQRLTLWLLGEPIPPDLPDRILPIFFRGVAS